MRVSGWEKQEPCILRDERDLMPPDRAWLRWPSRCCWAAFFGYGTLLVLLWAISYGGTSWITGLHDFRVRLHFDFELQMPFVPRAAIVYLSLFPLLWLSPFVLQSAAELRLLAKQLAWLLALSAIGFLVLPADEVRSQSVDREFFDMAFELADWINLSYNWLPSLHVGVAVVCAWTYARRVSVTVGIVFWVWAAAVMISTLITHQHYVADVVAGAALGFLVRPGRRRTPAR